MGKQRIKPNYRRRVLRLPDLDHWSDTSSSQALNPSSSMRLRSHGFKPPMSFAWHCSRSVSVILVIPELILMYCRCLD
jgi:hypothetical protein